MTATYPARPPYYAQQFARLLGKVCLGLELGPDTCWLLAFIASTEDAAGYRRAVTFFNEDLATRCGFSLAGMKRARDKAVAAGWLHYEPGAKGRAARYFVTVPPGYVAVDDGPGDEGDKGGIVAQAEPESGELPAQPEPETGRNVSRNPDTGSPARQKPSRIRTESGRNVSHILPSPSPTPGEENPPLPPRGGAAGANGHPGRFDPTALPLPFPSPAFREAWRQWAEYRRHRKPALTAETAPRQLAALSALAEADAIACIELSIRNGWQGVFPERFRTRGPPAGPRSKAEQQDDYFARMAADALGVPDPEDPP